VSREATHDVNGTPGQTVDVVPDGPDQMDERVAGQQPLQSWSLEPDKERAIPDFLPTTPLAVPGEVFQVLGLRMHDVEVGGPRCKDGILRAGGQSVAEFAF
jgi:hypothetical protein